MNIAIYQPRASYYVGGGEIVPLQQARYLTQNNHKVTLITSKVEFESDYFITWKKENTQVSVVYIKMDEKYKSIYKQEAGQDQLRWDLETFHIGQSAYRYFLKHSFDIVAVHYLLDVVAIPHHQKNIVHLHGHPSSPRYDFNIWTSYTPHFTAHSDRIKQKWLELAPMLPKDMSVTKNGIDSTYFKPLITEKKQYDALFIGRLIKTKGVNFFIEALRRVSAEGFNFNIAIGGTGPELNSLKDMVYRYKLDKNISFLGFIPENELVSFYNNADIAVFPSVSKEGILTTMLEAASCGLPVITSSDTSMNEFIKDNVNGSLIKPQDTTAFAKCLLNLFRNKEKTQEMGKKAREYVANEWDWSLRIKDVEKVYQLSISS